MAWQRMARCSAVALCCALLSLAVACATAEDPHSSSDVAAFAGSTSRPRNVYFIRHGEAYKNKGTESNDNSYDRLTDQGRQQALTTGQRISYNHLTACVTAPELRTRDTALAITMYSFIPMASVDGSLTSKAYDGEPDRVRADRGVAAVRRFMARTTGDVCVVSHGHLIQFMTSTLVGVPLEGSMLRRELVNGGVQHMRVDPRTNKWTKLESDGVVNDE